MAISNEQRLQQEADRRQLGIGVEAEEPIASGEIRYYLFSSEHQIPGPLTYSEAMSWLTSLGEEPDMQLVSCIYCGEDGRCDPKCTPGYVDVS